MSKTITKTKRVLTDEDRANRRPGADADPAPQRINLPRVDDTKNYAKFEVAAPARGSGQRATFGAVYLPLDEADGVTSLTVIVNR